MFEEDDEDADTYKHVGVSFHRSLNKLKLTLPKKVKKQGREKVLSFNLKSASVLPSRFKRCWRIFRKCFFIFQFHSLESGRQGREGEKATASAEKNGLVKLSESASMWIIIIIIPFRAFSLFTRPPTSLPKTNFHLMYCSCVCVCRCYSVCVTSVKYFIQLTIEEEKNSFLIFILLLFF